MLNSDYLAMTSVRISIEKLRHGLLFLLSATIVLVADQVTKTMVRANMDLGESIPDTGRFRLTYSTNDGAVFGLSVDSTFLTFMACTVVILIIWAYFSHFSEKSNWMLRLGLGLVLGGAVGNLVDRVRFGEVIDFIDVQLWGEYHWAIFNIADAALSTGVIMLMFVLLGGHKLFGK